MRMRTRWPSPLAVAATMASTVSARLLGQRDRADMDVRAEALGKDKFGANPRGTGRSGTEPFRVEKNSVRQDQLSPLPAPSHSLLTSSSTLAGTGPYSLSCSASQARRALRRSSASSASAT